MTTPNAALDSAPVGFADALRSEWVKLRSLRSTYWSMLTAAVLIVGLGVVFSFAYASDFETASAAERADFDPTTITLSGVWFAQLAIGVLGILVVTAEYASGTMRSSLAAVPRRGRMLAAKATVFGAVTLVVTAVASVAAFLAGQPILARTAPHASLGDAGALRAVVGAALYLTLLALLCVGLGVLIRHTAGAVATMVAILFAVPTVVSALPESAQNAARWLPSNAGSSVWIVVRTPDSLPAWTGFGAFAAYTALILLATFAVFARRDV